MAPLTKILLLAASFAAAAQGLALPEAAPKNSKDVSSTTKHDDTKITTANEQKTTTNSEKHTSKKEDKHTSAKEDHTSTKKEDHSSKKSEHSSTKRHEEPSATVSADVSNPSHKTHKSSNPVQGPLVGWYFADPSLIEVSGTWYSFATSFSSNGFTRNIQLARSSDFVHWEYVNQEVLPGTYRQRWAPDVIKSPSGHFIMNYAVPASKGACLYTAAASAIEGPYTDEREFHCETGGKEHGDIDGAYFQDHDGSLHIVYKNSTVHGKKRTTILTVQRVEDSGADWGRQMAPGSQAYELLHNEAEDDPQIEAPFLVYRNGVYFLTFSAHWWDTSHYDVKYATATKLTGPYTRANAPLLETGTYKNLNGPGGASFSRTGDQMVFHNRHGTPIAGDTVDHGKNRTLWRGEVEFSGHEITFKS